MSRAYESADLTKLHRALRGRNLETIFERRCAAARLTKDPEIVLRFRSIDRGETDAFDLSHIRASHPCFAVAVECLSLAQGVQRVRMVGCELTDSDVELLTHHSTLCPSLIAVDVTDNEGIGSRGAVALLDLLNHRRQIVEVRFDRTSIPLPLKQRLTSQSERNAKIAREQQQQQHSSLVVVEPATPRNVRNEGGFPSSSADLVDTPSTARQRSSAGVGGTTSRRSATHNNHNMSADHEQDGGSVEVLITAVFLTPLLSVLRVLSWEQPSRSASVLLMLLTLLLGSVEHAVVAGVLLYWFGGRVTTTAAAAPATAIKDPITSSSELGSEVKVEVTYPRVSSLDQPCSSALRELRAAMIQEGNNNNSARSIVEVVQWWNSRGGPSMVKRPYVVERAALPLVMWLCATVLLSAVVVALEWVDVLEQEGSALAVVGCCSVVLAFTIEFWGPVLAHPGGVRSSIVQWAAVTVLGRELAAVALLPQQLQGGAGGSGLVCEPPVVGAALSPPPFRLSLSERRGLPPLRPPAAPPSRSPWMSLSASSHHYSPPRSLPHTPMRSRSGSSMNGGRWLLQCEALRVSAELAASVGQLPLSSNVMLHVEIVDCCEAAEPLQGAALDVLRRPLEEGGDHAAPHSLSSTTTRQSLLHNAPMVVTVGFQPHLGPVCVRASLRVLPASHQVDDDEDHHSSNIIATGQTVVVLEEGWSLLEAAVPLSSVAPSSSLSPNASSRERNGDATSSLLLFSPTTHHNGGPATVVALLLSVRVLRRRARSPDVSGHPSPLPTPHHDDAVAPEAVPAAVVATHNESSERSTWYRPRRASVPDSRAVATFRERKDTDQFVVLFQGRDSVPRSAR